MADEQLRDRQRRDGTPGATPSSCLSHSGSVLPKVALIAEHREMDQQSASDALLALSMQQEEMHNALQRTLPPATPMPLTTRARRSIPVPHAHSAAA